jgi:hypothetical protein
MISLVGIRETSVLLSYWVLLGFCRPVEGQHGFPLVEEAKA